ncbi:OstA-like protein [Leptobacterium flavescens]|uniref:OstA-like protein n=1 Tax=Leptobacterium flavescens TaxID=472055 RepID=UPI003741F57E
MLGLKSLSRFVLFLFAVFFISGVQSQEKKKIDIIYGGTFSRDEIKHPGKSIFSKKNNRQVQFQHQGADLWCDLAVLNPKENLIEAYGNVRLNQGDTVQMNSAYLRYDGNSKLAVAKENVRLTNVKTTLTTDSLHFDRNVQEAYYESFGTVRDSVNVLTSNKGRYFIEKKKYQFLSDVEITHPEYVLNSAQLDYYTTTQHAYMYGPSTIVGKDYKVYCERGFYNTNDENGYFVKNSRIDYNNRIINGDSLYFNKLNEFASATNNIKVIDTINKGVVKGHYAEVFKAKDSVFITKRAVAINLLEKDSIYIHGDTLMVTGKPDHRIIRGFRNVKIYKFDLSGKGDSIHVDQKTGITQLIGKPLGPNASTLRLSERRKLNPVLWSGENQMTGDSIHLITNLETEKLDSLKILNNALIMQKDTLSKDGFNQVVGKDLFGKFIESELKEVDIIKNTEVIYYMYNDKNELIGINKSVCSAINMTFFESQIEDITFITNPDGTIYPEADLPVNARRLRGVLWRGDEMIRKKDDIFDEDDYNIELVKIRGIDNPIDIDAEESERSKEGEKDPEKNKAVPKAKAVIQEKEKSKSASKQ